MPREDVRCLCGYFFTVEDGVDRNTVTCPICTRPLADEYITPPPVPSAPPSVPEPPEDPLTPFVEETRKLRNVVPSLVIGAIVGVLILGAAVFAITVVGRLLGLVSDDQSSPVPAPRPVPVHVQRVPEVARDVTPVEPAVAKPRPPVYVPEPVCEIPLPAPAPAPASAPAPAPVAPEKAELETVLPADVVERVRGELLSLPSFYLDGCLAPDVRARMEQLIAIGRGRIEDVQFLRRVLDDDRCRSAREESAAIREAFSRLEMIAFKNLPEDRVELVDGRTLEGRLLEETPEGVQFERKVGGAQATMRLKRAEIRKIEKGKGIGVEFLRKWEAAKGGPAPLKASLLAWCREQGLAEQAALVTHLLLMTNPGHEEARAAAGLPKSFFPASMGRLTATPAPVAERPVEGMPPVPPPSVVRWIEYEGRSWDALALKERLISKGYAIFDGRWHTPVKKTFSLPGLSTTGAMGHPKIAVALSRNAKALRLDRDAHRPQDNNASSLALTEVVERTVVRRFYSIPQRTVTAVRRSSEYAGPRPFGTDVIYRKDSVGSPSPLVGDLFVTVAVGAPVMGGKVMTRIRTKPGGSATVHVNSRKGIEPLFVAARNEDDLHPLPQTVVGMDTLRFHISIVMANTFTSVQETNVVRPTRVEDGGRLLERGLMVVHDRLIPEYTVMVFPSDSSTREVFRLDLEVGAPADALNRLYEEAGALDVLE